MSHLALSLEIYLGTMLLVSGFAKAANTAAFRDTLLRHKILPEWIIPILSQSFPWFQVLVAIWLITAITPIAASFVLAALFFGFLVTEIVLVITRRATECGCYGVMFKQTVDFAAITASSILFSLAAVLTALRVIGVEDVSPTYRMVVFSAFIGLALLLLFCSVTISRRLSEPVLVPPHSISSPH